jgi:hypothetical protein
LTEHGFRTAFSDFHNHFHATAVRSTASEDAQQAARDRDLLLAEVERNPGDARSVFLLAHTYFDLGDFANARRWYARRVEMGGWDEEIFFAMYRIAEAMGQLGEPWPTVEDAFLRAWEFRPTRAEPLYSIAFRYRLEQQYQLGYLFAKLAAQIPLPDTDTLFVYTHIYAWCATDEQAICASQIGQLAEAFTLCRRLLAGADIPDSQRSRVTANRDISVPVMLEAASAYPDTLIHSLVTGPGDATVTVTVIAGPELAATEATLNSFLNCCTDISAVGRFLVLDTGLPAPDRAKLQQRYRFLQFADSEPDPPLSQIRTHIDGQYWLHLHHGWRFFAPENYITRLTAILHAEPHVSQVAINYTDATQLTSASAPEALVRHAPNTGRYLLTNQPANGPAMVDTTRLHHTTGGHTATLDEVLCITTT